MSTFGWSLSRWKKPIGKFTTQNQHNCIDQIQPIQCQSLKQGNSINRHWT